MKTTDTWFRAALVAALAVTTTACSSDDPAGPPEDDGKRDPETPLYAVATQIFTGDSAQTYLALSAGDETGVLTTDDAIELPGRSLVSGRVGGGAVFVGGNEGPTITRYDLEDGELRAGERVTFAGEGVAAFGEYQSQFVHVSDTKAYFLDGKTAQVVVWNPDEMTVTGTIGVPGLAVADTIVTFTSTEVIQTDGKVIVPVGWRSSDNRVIPSTTGVLVVNTSDDSAELVTDDRGGYVRDAVAGDDGFVYLATEAYASAVYRLAETNAPAPCLLRFDAKAGAFDPDYYHELAAVAGGTAGSLVRNGARGKALIGVLDESLATIAETTVPRALASQPAWSWKTLTLGDSPATSDSDVPPSGGSVLFFPGDGADYYSVFGVNANDEDETAVMALSGDAAGTPLVNVQGLVFSMVQVR